MAGVMCGLAFDSASVRLDRLEETIALLRASFADGELDMIGKHVHAVGFEAVPKPVRRPSPPLMIGGGSRRVLGIAGREADIVSLNLSGRVGAAGVASSTAELTDRKIEWIRAGAGNRFDDIEIEIGAYFTIVTDDPSAVEKMAARFSLSPEAFAEHPHALIGSVDSICEQLVTRRERYGISYVTFGAAAMDEVAPIVERLTGS
jgi:alkanesulfonate monooxygenase SsuD/methylene tetrahydromethanopterin reductase-like flavin-dependent oxidoreductase (luciferase family)